jgi:hypothetical protein
MQPSDGENHRRYFGQQWPALVKLNPRNLLAQGRATALSVGSPGA